jgi:hypothetical protein
VGLDVLHGREFLQLNANVGHVHAQLGATTARIFFGNKKDAEILFGRVAHAVRSTTQAITRGSLSNEIMLKISMIEANCITFPDK